MRCFRVCQARLFRIASAGIDSRKCSKARIRWQPLANGSRQREYGTVPQPTGLVQWPNQEHIFGPDKDVLYNQLSESSNEQDYPRTQALVSELVLNHGERPNLRIYTALVLANASPNFGSAAEAEALLGELEDEGITPDSAFLHAMLRVGLDVDAP